jgi:hypothetical protein
MKKSITIISILGIFILSACSANKVGIKGYQEFTETATVESLTSEKSYTDFARCFEQNAKLYPLSEVKYIEARNEAVYELAGYGWWFETIQFVPQDKGSVANIRLANNYDEKWMNDFRKDRYTALLKCK